VFRELSERPVLPEDVSVVPEQLVFRKYFGRPSSGSSGRTPNGSSGSRHRHQAVIFSGVFYPKVPLT